MKYGLLTPYTSFLADERVPLHAMSEQPSETRQELAVRSMQVSGELGVSQRDLKQAIHGGRAGTRQTPAAATSEILQIRRPQPRSRRGKLGPPQQAQTEHSRVRVSRARRHDGRDERPGRRLRRNERMCNTSACALAQANAAAICAGRTLKRGARLKLPRPTQSNVRQIGTKTFYFKNGRWVDSSVKPDEDAKAVKIAQFSDEYFRLARTQKAEYNQYLSQEEPVTVKLEGRSITSTRHRRMRRLAQWASLGNGSAAVIGAIVPTMVAADLFLPDVRRMS